MIRVKKFGAERTYATYVENAWESGFWGVLNKNYFKETGKITKVNVHGWVCFESIAGRSLRPQISRETRNAKHTVCLSNGKDENPALPSRKLKTGSD